MALIHVPEDFKYDKIVVIIVTIITVFVLLLLIIKRHVFDIVRMWM